MPKSYDYESRWVMSTVTVAEDGRVTEVNGFRAGTVHAMQFDRVEGGAVFPSIGAWVAAMDAETARRAPWSRRQHKLSSIGDRSSVVWVQSKGHYMEVRRGEQTKFSAAERRYWLSVEEWVASLTPPPAVTIKVDEVEAPVPVVEAVVLAAPAPAVVTAFNVEKFRETWAQLRDLTRKETGALRSTHVIQLCQFLLDTRPAAAEWLAENPVWRYTVRAIVQELGWSAGNQGAHNAVAAFLEKF
jgi:hypothetical protein